MPPLKPSSQWVEQPLINFDERYRVEILFNQSHGWEWRLDHRDDGGWHVLDSGLCSTIQWAVHAAQQALGQVYG